MFTETVCPYRQKIHTCVPIFLIFFLVIPKLSHAIGINLEGRTSFDGIPSGVIRDLEVSNKVVYVAAENGVFEVIGHESEKLDFNTSNHATGVISDIQLNGTDLWVVEYGVGVFKVNLENKNSQQVFSDREWSSSIWTMAMTSSHLYFSVIDDVIAVDRTTGQSTSLNSKLESFKLNGTYSLFANNHNAYVASNKGYLSIEGALDNLQEFKLSSKLPLLSNATFIKVIDDELYIGGPQGVYILGSNERFVPTEGISGTYIQDVVKGEDGVIWVSDGRLLLLEDEKLSAPPFMNPILTSEAIRSVTKIAIDPYNSILIASSQLGLVSLPKTKLVTNLVSFNGSVVRENIQKTSINENGTIVRTEKGLFQLNEKSGELVNTHLDKDKAEFCTSWQERTFIRLNEIDPL